MIRRPPRSTLFPLHDALPISRHLVQRLRGRDLQPIRAESGPRRAGLDRKSTRLNSSHVSISYAVFCLKKKKKQSIKKKEYIKSNIVISRMYMSNSCVLEDVII